MNSKFTQELSADLLNGRWSEYDSGYGERGEGYVESNPDGTFVIASDENNASAGTYTLIGDQLHITYPRKMWGEDFKDADYPLEPALTESHTHANGKQPRGALAVLSCIGPHR